MENQTTRFMLLEASLAAMSLGVGLTHIRKYSFAQKGFFFSGLYSLTIGAERVLKLIVIYDHRLKHNGAFPTNSEIRKYGHKLSELFDYALKINKTEHLADDSFWNDPICKNIIEIWSDFAIQARYYNLDYVTGKQQISNIEPLERWEKEVVQKIIDRHFKTRFVDSAQLVQYASFIDSFSDILHTSETGLTIDNARDLIINEEKIPVKQKYSMYYSFSILHFLYGLLSQLEIRGNFFPHLREFFAIFGIEERDKIMSRRTWNPYPPYKF